MTILGIIGAIIMGLIIGLIAKAVMPGRDPGGTLVTILLGIAGSFVGSIIGSALFGYGREGASGDISSPGFLMNLLLGVVGAVVLLAIYRLATGRSLRA